MVKVFCWLTSWAFPTGVCKLVKWEDNVRWTAFLLRLVWVQSRLQVHSGKCLSPGCSSHSCSLGRWLTFPSWVKVQEWLVKAASWTSRKNTWARVLQQTAKQLSSATLVYFLSSNKSLHCSLSCCTLLLYAYPSKFESLLFWNRTDLGKCDWDCEIGKKSSSTKTQIIT